MGAQKEHQLFLSVFDGHGPNGAYASHFVRDQLPKEYLEIANDIEENPREAMKVASLKVRRASPFIL